MTDQRKIIEERAREIFTDRAEDYVTSAAHTDSLVLSRMVELAQPQPDWRVLDVATGTGHTAFAFAPYVAEIIGIDLTPQMLAEAEKLAASKEITNVRFAVANIHELPFDDEIFDDEQFDSGDLPPRRAPFRRHRRGSERNGAHAEARRAVADRRPQHPGG